MPAGRWQLVECPAQRAQGVVSRGTALPSRFLALLILGRRSAGMGGELVPSGELA